ncbi:MAG: hypothetical protein LQ342_008033 [Letrouitia transgressa]|nr:MAG: hypothetical protein LQ342_008033 [Letrouitia transgressa]
MASQITDVEGPMNVDADEEDVDVEGPMNIDADEEAFQDVDEEELLNIDGEVFQDIDVEELMSTEVEEPMNIELINIEVEEPPLENSHWASHIEQQQDEHTGKFVSNVHSQRIGPDRKARKPRGWVNKL